MVTNETHDDSPIHQDTTTQLLSLEALATRSLGT